MMVESPEIEGDLRTPLGQSDDHLVQSDDHLVRLIATALFQIAVRADQGEVLVAPYPPIVQRAMDRLAVTCLLRGHDPPQSLPDLFAWCRRPLLEWPLKLEDGCCEECDTLLDGCRITNLCDEWAEEGVCDVEAELSQRKVIEDVRQICRTLDRQDCYVGFRRYLIEQPVVTQFELQRALATPMLAQLRDQMKNCYVKVPLCHCDDDGNYKCCAVCHGLLLRVEQGNFVCENERCRINGEFATGVRLKADDGVLWLRREFRRYIAAPGQAELRLFEDLQDIGAIECELWPALDNYDILIRFPDGAVWAVDVKDQSNPFLLAANATPPPDLPPWDRAFFVFPDERRRERSDYMRAFSNHAQVLTGRVEASFRKEFVTRVKRELRSKQKCETPATGEEA